MKTFHDYFKEFTDDQLERAYGEYRDWCKKGVLQDGELRTVYEEYEKENGAHVPIFTITEPLLNELIVRYRDQLGK